MSVSLAEVAPVINEGSKLSKSETSALKCDSSKRRLEKFMMKMADGKVRSAQYLTFDIIYFSCTYLCSVY